MKLFSSRNSQFPVNLVLCIYVALVDASQSWSSVAVLHSFTLLPLVPI